MIEKLGKEIKNLHAKYKLTIPNKVHIAVSHVPDYIDLTQFSLGQTSDQLIEASHQYVNKRFMGSRYFVKNLENPTMEKNYFREQII